MKKFISVFFIFLLAVSFLGCPSGGGNDNGDDDDDDDDGDDITIIDPDTDPEPGSGTENKTWVRFNNDSEFYVNIYSDLSRMNKIADVRAGNYALIETGHGEAQFFPNYNIIIDDVSFPYKGEGIIARIDAGKTKTDPNKVYIPSLENLDGEELVKPLTSLAYVKIQNNDKLAIVFRSGTSELKPEGASSAILMYSETGLYGISPGSAGNYSFRKNATTPIPFPEKVTQFASGNLYSFRYNGTSLALLSERKLTLSQVYTLSPPENISARSLPSGSIALSWEKVGTETSYKIYRAKESPETPETFEILYSTENTSYTDDDVKLENTYYYKIASAKGALVSAQSGNYAGILSRESNLASPSGLSASALSADSISLSWNSVSDAASYVIYRGFSSDSIKTYVTSTSVRPYTISGLESNTIYYFTVSSINDTVESVPSNHAHAETLSGSISGLQSPSDVTAAALGTSSIQITWSAVSDATGYKVYRSLSADGDYSFAGNSASTTYTNTGLSAGTVYYYKVTAVKDDIESSLSSYAYATTGGSSGTIDYPPVMPTGLIVSSVSSGSITLSWTSVSSAASYNIYRSSTQTGTPALVGTVSSTSYTDSVSSGVSFYYTVTGVNSSGESPKSSVTFAFAAPHSTLQYNGDETNNLSSGGKIYYRFSVYQGSSYTIQWHDGDEKYTPRYFNVTAYQSNGAQIFSQGSSSASGYPSFQQFTAADSGYVTVVVSNETGSSQNYQIYYY